MKHEGNHRFIRGNHDDPAACRSQSLCITDGHSEADMFFCGGALSVNLKGRTEGLNWWPDEELSDPDFASIREKYLDEKPAIMVTHDCPHEVAQAVFQAESQAGDLGPELFPVDGIQGQAEATPGPATCGQGQALLDGQALAGPGHGVLENTRRQGAAALS